jgi:cellulose synthase/poly-beta-1,6-N-acetylglucosamine synthase-like glycosyltransferase
VIFVQVLYVISALILSLMGFNALILSLVYLWHRHDDSPLPDRRDKQLPSVVVQLPIYNERDIVERLIEAASNLDYPRDRLTIQVLDDSTDDTSNVAALAVERARAAGVPIGHIHRENRVGFKAGALVRGLERTDAEFVAIFDSDFVPAPDFLQRMIPYFLEDGQLGMAQARWGHVNPDDNLLTRAQVLALDAHFVIEQTARHRGGLLMNFAGTAGIWRRACIDDSGGWHSDTLSEDIDLSYRAQLRGWRCLYLPDVVAPAELTPVMMAFKRQQSRWATGTIQCLRKLGPKVLGSRLNIAQKFEAVLHLGGYLIHPAMVLMMLTVLPLMMSGQLSNLPLAGLSVAMFGPPLANLIAQRRVSSSWAYRMSFLPILMLIGVGIAASNTLAVVRGFSSHAQPFHRTPKFHVRTRAQGWTKSIYQIPLDATTGFEVFLALYAGLTSVLALDYAPSLVPFMTLYALGFAYVAGLSLWQARAVQRVRAHEQHTLSLSGNKL